EPIQLPIDGVLDLHTFKPAEIKEVVTEFLAACRQRGIFQVRLIHGKGIGNLRRTVHAILSKHPEVISFTLDHPQYGGWGATLVSLRPQCKDGGSPGDSEPLDNAAGPRAVLGSQRQRMREEARNYSMLPIPIERVASRGR